jgi:hypothetical protein
MALLSPHSLLEFGGHIGNFTFHWPAVMGKGGGGRVNPCTILRGQYITEFERLWVRYCYCDLYLALFMPVVRNSFLPECQFERIQHLSGPQAKLKIKYSWFFKKMLTLHFPLLSLTLHEYLLPNLQSVGGWRRKIVAQKTGEQRNILSLRLVPGYIMVESRAQKGGSNGCLYLESFRNFAYYMYCNSQAST